MKRRTILIGAAVLIVGALIVWYRWPQPVAQADAIKVLGLVGEPKSEPGTNLWSLSVAVSNTTRKTLAVSWPTLQIRCASGWTNFSEGLDLSQNFENHIGPFG